MAEALDDLVQVGNEKILKARIAFFIPSFGGGGAELIMVQLANTIEARGACVDLVVSNAEGQWRNRVAPGVRIIDLKSRRVVLSLPKLIGYIRREQPVVMLSTLMRANVIAILANLLAGRVCKIFVREASAKSVFDGRSNFREKMLPKIASLTYSWANGVVALNEGVRKNIQEVLKVDSHKIHIIPNPVDYRSIQELALMPISHEWVVQPRKLFLAVGRLEVEKGFDVLLKAFALVKEKRNESVLIILGEGSKRSEMEALISKYGLDKSVQLLGFVQNPFPFMNAASVLVQSSRIEGFPNVIAQALALNARVVATDSHGGGANDVLQGGMFGHLVPVDQPEILAEAMLKAAFGNEPIPDEAALKQHLKQYEVDSVVNKYLSLLCSN